MKILEFCWVSHTSWCEIIYVLIVSNPAYKSWNDLVSSISLVQENLEKLVMTERIESVIPVTYIALSA